MRVLTKVVIRISDCKVVSSEGYDYDGPVAECKGGGGGGGSGKVSYPAYMETWHSTWLDNTGTAMTTAQAANPWTGETAYDPDTELAVAWCAICALNTVVDAMDHRVDWNAAMMQAETTVDALISDSYITADSDAYNTILTDQLDDVDLPKFKAGMSDINAVMSSAFVVGQSVMYAYKERNVAKYTADLRVKLCDLRNKMIVGSASEMIKALIQEVEFKKAVAHMTVEEKRIHIVAKDEEASEQLSIDENDALWDLDTFQYGANMLAAIGGGTNLTSSGQKKPSKAQSALGGALSGAAAGAMVPGAGAVGAAVGGVIGGIGGLLMG